MPSQPEAYLSVDIIREIDRLAVAEYGVPSIVLMENASRGCVDLLLANCQPAAAPVVATPAVTILCGKGNNAGDGLAMARHLDLRGAQVTVVLVLGDEFSGDAEVNFSICRASGISVWAWEDKTPDEWQAHFNQQDWLVDALLGTGATGNPRPPLDTVLQVANAAAVKRFAVDTPTGLNCETGEVAECCYRADVTATFVAKKKGFAHRAAAVLGNVRVLDIGAPRVLVEKAFAGELD